MCIGKQSVQITYLETLTNHEYRLMFLYLRECAPRAHTAATISAPRHTRGINPYASTWSQASTPELLKSSSSFKKNISLSYNRFHLHFTEILTAFPMVVTAKSSGVTINSYVPLSDLCNRRIFIIVDWLSVILKMNRSWASLATWIVPPLLYLATLREGSEGESEVKSTSTWSRGEPSRVYVHWRVMLSFSTGYNGFEGVEIKDGACSMRRKENKIVFGKVRLTMWSISEVLEKERERHSYKVYWFSIEGHDMLIIPNSDKPYGLNTP